MNDYLERQVEQFEALGKLAAATDDPLHRGILLNYRRHLGLEYGERDDEIVLPDMTVDHPLYRVQDNIMEGFGQRLGTGEIIEHDGTEAVLGFYRSMNDFTVALSMNEQIAVADWGFASFEDIVMFISGDKLAERGLAGEDTAAHYIAEGPVAMRWRYDGNARLIGEDIWQREVFQIRRADPSEVVTLAERTAVASRYVL